MRHKKRSQVMEMAATALLGASLFCSPAVAATGRLLAALNGDNDNELLMFWEEKELYVQTATRSEKPLSQVAENMTVITSREIELTNATNLNQVLARVPGLFADIPGNDFNSPASLHIQGSAERHVTVLLDGMPINFLAGGNADTTFIPIKIVERIEIIKGAASSSWGSALGGVINIITRATGDTGKPGGSLGVSQGEKNSYDLNAELTGRKGMLGYYLYAGQQASDGLRNDREYRRDSLFGKLLLTPNRDLDLTVSAGYSDPQQSYGDVPVQGAHSESTEEILFLNGALEYRVTPELTLRGALHFFHSRNDFPTHFLADGSLVKRLNFKEQTVGGNLRATWSSGIQTVTLGVEASHGELDETAKAGPLYQMLGSPATVTASPSIDRWALFANDTIEWGKLTATPGIRLDHDDISGYFVSPSLGLTWELGEHSLLRASAARGFTSPPLGYSSGQGLFFQSNPDLEYESGWSYQAGIETGVCDLLNLKGTLFRNDTRDIMTAERATDSSVRMVNGGDATRQGYELEVETVPLYNLSARASHSYAHTRVDDIPEGRDENHWDTYSWLVGIKYDDRHSFSALLSGSYIWWDVPHTTPAYANPCYGTFIWDLTGTKRFRVGSAASLETFLTIHNLFSGSHYTSSFYPNPSRWVEGGVRLHF